MGAEANLLPGRTLVAERRIGVAEKLAAEITDRRALNLARRHLKLLEGSDLSEAIARKAAHCHKGSTELVVRSAVEAGATTNGNDLDQARPKSRGITL